MLRLPRMWLSPLWLLQFVSLELMIPLLTLGYTLVKGFTNDHHLRVLNETVVCVGQLAFKPHLKIPFDDAIRRTDIHAPDDH